MRLFPRMSHSASIPLLLYHVFLQSTNKPRHSSRISCEPGDPLFEVISIGPPQSVRQLIKELELREAQHPIVLPLAPGFSPYRVNFRMRTSSRRKLVSKRRKALRVILESCWYGLSVPWARAPARQQLFFIHSAIPKTLRTTHTGTGILV